MRAIFATLAAVLLPGASLAQSCEDGNWPYAYQATVVSVYDGDTITADVDLGFNVWLKGETFRLYGINAPEVRGSERPLGLLTRDWLRSRIDGRQITIKTIADKKGKYGRWLAILCDDQGDVIEDMVSAGLAERREY